jgi:hypothetical protein
MPWSQMIIMNWRPPRAIEDSRPAMLPAVNALIRKRRSWNIGRGTIRSITTNAARTASPPASSVMTRGLVHPMVWPP